MVKGFFCCNFYAVLTAVKKIKYTGEILQIIITYLDKKNQKLLLRIQLPMFYIAEAGRWYSRCL